MDPSTPYFPIFYRAEGAPVLVIGAGRVAERKIRSLLLRGARITVVAKKFSPAIRRMGKAGEVTAVRSSFRGNHLEKQRLVFAATGDRAVNRAVSREAVRRGIPVNVADSPQECTFILPAVVEQGEFTLAVSTGGRHPGAARAIREFLEDRRAEVSVRMERGRRRNGIRAARGAVYIVGAGPGDPDLLSVRALGLLRSADAVIHDYLVPPEVLSLAPEKARRICYARRGRTSGHGSALKQAAIHATMARLAREGKRVVRLKSGDPMVFGRGGEEAEFLAAEGIPFEVVPGITAAVACAAAANLPLTHRGLSSSVTFLAGHETGEKEASAIDWNRLPKNGTLAVYMGMGRIEEIGRSLARAGFPADMPFAVVENGTKRSQRILRGRLSDLSRIAEKQRFRSPAILFVGRAAAPSAGKEQGGLPAVRSRSGLPGTATPLLRAGREGKGA